MPIQSMQCDLNASALGASDLVAVATWAILHHDARRHTRVKAMMIVA